MTIKKLKNYTKTSFLCCLRLWCWD